MCYWCQNTSAFCFINVFLVIIETSGQWYLPIDGVLNSDADIVDTGTSMDVFLQPEENQDGEDEDELESGDGLHSGQEGVVLVDAVSGQDSKNNDYDITFEERDGNRFVVPADELPEFEDWLLSVEFSSDKVQSSAAALVHCMWIRVLVIVLLVIALVI